MCVRRVWYTYVATGENKEPYGLGVGLWALHKENDKGTPCECAIAMDVETVPQ